MQKRNDNRLPYKRKHFGYIGRASDGHRFESLNELDLEEWLINRKIEHIPHYHLGDTNRSSDQYLPDYNVHIEVDGLDRKDDIDWYGKLTLYNKMGLTYKIIKPTSVHFKDDKEKCFGELDNKMKDIWTRR